MEQENTNEQENVPTELEERKKLCDEYLAGWQRERADFLNYKKDEAQRIGSVIYYAKKNLLFGVLAILDNLQRAKDHLPENIKGTDWGKGFSQIENQFGDFLKSEGIEEIPAQDAQFNPEMHEAIEEIEGEESGRVAQVIEKGYTINGKLLRPAKVKVNK
ncbi:MAG: nucleotide exchange factor GrpE [Patescibacteria group bacterium]|nr:nucleotide exchange factor GrpE [Patescibacteria group bacterium]